MSGKMMALYAGLLGLVCVVVGVLELVGGLGMPHDTFGGLVMLVVGSVYLCGVRELAQEKREGISFVLVGVMLSWVFGVLYLLMMGASFLDALVVGERALIDVRAEIVIPVLTLPAIHHLRAVWAGGEGAP